MRSGLAAAYSSTGGAWQDGPGRVYDRLAEVVVARSPEPLGGCTVVDVGAGTGAATRAVLRAGARSVVAVDVAPGMLRHDAARRPPAVAGDVLTLPFADRAFHAAVAAFSLNHLTDPASGLVEMTRVTRPGGILLASAYAADDRHPARDAVEAALTAAGWTAEDWVGAMRREATPLMATVDGCRATASAAALDAVVDAVRVPFPELTARDLVEWRLGMAQHAPFVAALSTDVRAALVADSLRRLGPEPPPLVRSLIVMCALRP